MPSMHRRRLLRFAALGIGTILAGCDKVAQSAGGRRAMSWGETLSYRVQRLLIGANRLAPEFAEADIAPAFRANGNTDPWDPKYRAQAKNNFTDWKLEVDGLVASPTQFSLAELKALPSRTQVTRHDCVEGWSCIGKWKGVPLGLLLEKVGVRPEANYVVFHCADTWEGTPLDDDDFPPDGDSDAPAIQPVRYYESIDLVDARHPQTILAYEMNNSPLPVAHGAPLRLRVERQLGYKMAKYVMRIELVDDFSKIGDGQGGYWEDRGYDWYAGI